MTIRVVILAAVGVLMWPGLAAACTRSTAPPRVEASLVQTDAKGDVVLLVCERRTGKSRVLRDGVDSSTSARTVLGRPAVDGWQVIWSEVGGRRRVQTQRMVDLRRPTVQRRRVLGPVGDRGIESAELATVRLPDHVLAWTEVTKDDNSGRLMIGRLGRRPRVLVSEGVRTVGVQDGRTIVWSDVSGRNSYIDMARLPRRDGCPVRSSFNRVVLTNRLLAVTASTYGDYRICWRASGRDEVAVHSAAEVSYSFAAAGEHVLIQTLPWNKYQTCDRQLMGVGVFNARLQRPERAHVDLGCARYSPVVLAGTGAAAWITTINDVTEALQVLGPDGTVGNLDTGPIGSLGALAATDTAFTWTHDGQPRTSPAT